MKGIWEEVLKSEGIGLEEDFFEAGGHSLLATQVVIKIRRIFGVTMPIRILFENPTIKSLWREIESRARGDEHAESVPIKPVRRDNPLPLSYAQQRLWFIHQLEPDSAAYIFRAPCGCEGNSTSVV